MIQFLLHQDVFNVIKGMYYKTINVMLFKYHFVQNKYKVFVQNVKRGLI